MKRFGALLCCGLALGPTRALACSCSGQGPASAVTTPDQTIGLRLSERLVFGYGAFNAHGEYRAFAPGEHDRSVTYTWLAAYRYRRLELSGTFGYGAREVLLSSETGRSQGLLDTTLRARYEATDEPAPFQGGAYPSLALVGTLRLPTGAAGEAPLGLGSSELSLGLVLERTLERRWRIGLLGEVAGRLPDTTLGQTRQLGPRASTELTFAYFATPEWVMSALVGLRWESDVTFGGRQQSGTGARETQLAASVSYQPNQSPFRAGVTERYTPALAWLGVNSLQSATTEFWLGYAR